MLLGGKVFVWGSMVDRAGAYEQDVLDIIEGHSSG